ncbi:MAG: hypothetical protein P8K05_05215 [Dehalococcoidia bacterium]|nr:hypothetical protein [Dehalococcoidia bacterium]
MKIINITASRHAVFYSPLLAMVNGNFLEEEGLKGKYHKPKENINIYEKIKSKEIDVAQSAVSGSWNFLKKKIDSSIKHFALINSRDGFFIISKNLNPFQWNDLYKDPFYYVKGGQPEAMLSYALSKKNIDISKIPNVSNKVLSTSEMISEYKKEKKGFFHEQGSYPHELSRENQGKIIKSIGEIIGPVAFSSLCAEKEWIKSQEGMKFSRAFEKAKKWVNTSDPIDIGKLIKNHFENFSLESVTKAIKDYQILKTWESGIEISQEEYDKSLDVFEHSKIISKRYSINDVVMYS